MNSAIVFHLFLLLEGSLEQLDKMQDVDSDGAKHWYHTRSTDFKLISTIKSSIQSKAAQLTQCGKMVNDLR